MEPKILAQLHKRPAGEVVDLYVAIRDRRDACRAREAKLQKDLDAIGGVIQQKLFDAKQKGFRNEDGTYTAFTSIRRTARCSDKQAFREFAYANPDYDLLETSASLEACDQYAHDHAVEDPETGEVTLTYPPGMNVHEMVKLNVRKT